MNICSVYTGIYIRVYIGFISMYIYVYWFVKIRVEDSEYFSGWLVFVLIILNVYFVIVLFVVF